MKSKEQAPRFSFDFSHADRLSWRHGPKNDDNGAMFAGFFLNDQEIADEFAQVLEPLLADALDIAAAVHMADRLAIRSAERSDNWSRILELQVCVRHPEAWAQARFKERLERLFGFLTEDTWRFEFVLRQDSKRRSEIQKHLFPKSADGNFEVSLFSGGLDSFAGTAAALLEWPEKRFVLVSACGNPRQRSRQQEQVKVLRRKLCGQVSHVCVPYGMRRGDEYAQEPSRRTRGFLFTVLGAVTAISAGASELVIYENGLGAINLPFDQSQIGVDNARAVHPRALRETADVFSLIGEKNFSIVNRCIYVTKAEMLQHAAIDPVREAIPLTFSCDGFPVRTRGHAQCGFCTSCLLRRFSLEMAGLIDFDSNDYLQDWRSNSFVRSKHHLRGLRAMDWQAQRFRGCLESSDQWHALILEFPELRIIANDLCLLHSESPATVKVRLLRVLKQHAADWLSFSALPLLGATNRQVA